MNLYDLEFGKRYSFIATVNQFVTDEISTPYCSARLPDYWNKDRIILTNVKIYDGNNYVEFEPIIKMDMGKQFQKTKEYDIISFNAKVGIIKEYHIERPELIEHSLLDIIYDDGNYENDINKLSLILYKVSYEKYNVARRLIYPSNVEIEDRISTDNDEDMEDYTIKVA